MIKLPFFLVDLDLSQPLLWNGRSVELAGSKYQEIEQKILRLKQERATAITKVQKIRLDLGQIKRLDLFDLAANVKQVEQENRRLQSLLSYLEVSRSNINARLDSYRELTALIAKLQESYQDMGDPLIKEVESKRLLVSAIQAKISVLNTIVYRDQDKSRRIDLRLQSCSSKAKKIASTLLKISGKLTMIDEANQDNYRLLAEVQGLKSSIVSRETKNETDLDYLASRLCDLNIKFIRLFNELNEIVETLSQAFSLTTFLTATIETAKRTLDKVSENVLILQDFYLEAERKIRAVENYLSAFIVGGDNVHLDFGLDYTIVHAVPPPIPLCPDPEPCPGSIPVVVSSTKPPTLTTKAPLDLGTRNKTTAKPDVVLNPADWCYPTDKAYLGCYVVYAIVGFNEHYQKNISYDGEWSDQEVLRVECYFDPESKIEAEFDAKMAMDTWNKVYQANKAEMSAIITDPVMPYFNMIEVAEAQRCRQIFREDKL